MTRWLVVLGLTLVGCSSPPKQFSQAEEEKVSKGDYCRSSKEFIVVYEFLKQQPYFENQWAQRVSEKASQGCEGAAKRFVKSMKILLKTGVYTDDAVKVSLQIAKATDKQAETFFETYQKSYLKEYLDLNVGSSIKIARRLSYKFDGSSETAKNDFASFVKFCAGDKNLGFSLPMCAKFALRLTTYGEGKGVAVFPKFKKVFDFMISDKGPKQPTDVALKAAERLVRIHPLAAEDFVATYNYGIKPKGLALDKGQALQLAEKVVRTRLRVPASK